MEDRDADAMGTLCLEYGDSIQISYKEVPRATVESLLPKSYRLPHLDLGVYLVALPSGSTEPCSGAGASDRPDDASTAALATPASALCAIVTCSALQMFASERRHLFTAAALDDLRVSLPSDMMYRLKYFCLGQVLDAIPRHFARDMPRYAVWFLRQGLSQAAAAPLIVRVLEEVRMLAPVTRVVLESIPTPILLRNRFHGSPQYLCRRSGSVWADGFCLSDFPETTPEPSAPRPATKPEEGAAKADAPRAVLGSMAEELTQLGMTDEQLLAMTIQESMVGREPGTETDSTPAHEAEDPNKEAEPKASEGAPDDNGPCGYDEGAGASECKEGC